MTTHKNTENNRIKHVFLLLFFLTPQYMFVFTVTLTWSAEFAMSTFKCLCSYIVNPCCGLAQLVVPSFWKGMLGICGYLPIYNGKPCKCLCCADRCYLCQPLFLLLSPPSSLIFPLFLSAQPVSCSCSFLFRAFSLLSSASLSSALLPPRSIWCPDAEKAAVLCFKVCPIETTVPGICCWQKIITNPHYRHLSLSLTLSCHLCLLILWY